MQRTFTPSWGCTTRCLAATAHVLPGNTVKAPMQIILRHAGRRTPAYCLSVDCFVLQPSHSVLLSHCLHLLF